ncbi:helix-turn-helix domain-containing protein [Heyndrickxia ginsengihumi]|uniref:helix-turn-helix domain-containing protein n=1 Tax=Heyndrickxia ginsengihumi TaxID=363870 RepID=UPI003D229A48
MKDSAYVGKSIETLQKQEELTQEQLAFDLNVSASQVSHYKTERRKMHREVAENALYTYGHNFEFALSLLHEFSDHITSPVMNGKMIEHHRMVLEENTEKEMLEALKAIEEVSLAKPPEYVTAQERERVGWMMDELLDVRTVVDNLLSILEKDYEIPVKDRMKRRLPTWKSWGWI